jgi:hypothetical protein
MLPGFKAKDLWKMRLERLFCALFNFLSSAGLRQFQCTKNVAEKMNER